MNNNGICLVCGKSVTLIGSIALCEHCILKKDYNKLDSIKQALIDEYLKNLSEKQLKNRKLKSEIPPDDKSEEFYSLIGIWVVFGIGSLLVGAILFYGFGIKIK